MKPEEAVREIVALLAELERLGGAVPSPALRKFLRSLEARNKNNLELRSEGSPSRRPRVAAGGKKDSALMAKTIDELASKLRENFMSDTAFEATVNEAAASGLSKDNVVALYNRLFETKRTFPRSATKPDLFNAIRRDRIARVRARS